MNTMETSIYVKRKCKLKSNFELSNCTRKGESSIEMWPICEEATQHTTYKPRCPTCNPTIKKRSVGGLTIFKLSYSINVKLSGFSLLLLWPTFSTGLHKLPNSYSCSTRWGFGHTITKSVYFVNMYNPRYPTTIASVRLSSFSLKR